MLATRFALTIAAALCIIFDRYIAFDAFGAAGLLLAMLLRGFLAPFNFVHHLLFRASIRHWESSTPTWWSWLSTAFAFLPYLLLDLFLGAARADRNAVKLRR